MDKLHQKKNLAGKSKYIEKGNKKYTSFGIVNSKK
jgi:hypothetical protein